MTANLGGKQICFCRDGAIYASNPRRSEVDYGQVLQESLACLQPRGRFKRAMYSPDGAGEPAKRLLKGNMNNVFSE